MVNKSVNIEEFEKNFIKFVVKELPKLDIVAEKLAKGLSASYTDSKGRFIREYPNGKKFLIKYNKKTKKTYEAEEVVD